MSDVSYAPNLAVHEGGLASRLIEAYTRQPCLLVRTGTMRMDLWSGLGVLPQPGHTFTKAELDGEEIDPNGLEFDGTVYRFDGVTLTHAILKLTGTWGWGEVTDEVKTDDDAPGTVYSLDGVLNMAGEGFRVAVPDGLSWACRELARAMFAGYDHGEDATDDSIMSPLVQLALAPYRRKS